ncbi:Uncharacterised protein [Vibrio mimicus]|nr:hypothetical protein P781_12160 [Vibrio mimicus CAIM 1883]ERM55009.1 hypothetical protein P780_12130 [Vibrio mimicus CAIM 1882]SUP12691.1 Uncharacterised protein [Vibrio mimicus]
MLETEQTHPSVQIRIGAQEKYSQEMKDLK